MLRKDLRRVECRALPEVDARTHASRRQQEQRMSVRAYFIINGSRVCLEQWHRVKALPMASSKICTPAAFRGNSHLSSIAFSWVIGSVSASHRLALRLRFRMELAGCYGVDVQDLGTRLSEIRVCSQVRGGSPSCMPCDEDEKGHGVDCPARCAQRQLRS